MKEPTDQYCSKFRHLTGYLWETRFLPLIISIDDEGEVVTCIDGAHAVRAYGKMHSGMFLTMGKGAMMNVSKKLGVVTASSTETKIVADGEIFPKCSWFRYFRMAQGDSAKEDMLMQDNESAIILHKHHPFSVGKGSKHMNARNLFVADKINQKEVMIVHCPTAKMVADYSAKPLQGIAFVTHRSKMQGINKEDFRMHKE